MSFMYPLGLLGLIGVPILIIIYILRSKYNEQTVPSTYLWTLSEKFFKRRNPLSGITGIISLILQILMVIILSLAILFGALSCRQSERAEDMLYRICTELELPSGETYLKSAEEGSTGYLDQSMINTLYGKEGASVFLLIEDYAIYLSSFAVPYEVAVFKCYSRSDSDSVAELCLERIETLKVILRDSEHFELVQRARVEIKGRYVVMKIA